MAKEETTIVRFKLDADIMAWLKVRAAESGQSVNDYAAALLREGRKEARTLERISFNMPNDIADRLRAYAKEISRPYGWVICDAVSVYLDSVAAPVAGPDSVDLRKAGKTPAIRRGRPKVTGEDNSK